MNPLSQDIRQYGTHNTLFGQTGPQDAPQARLDLDAIIVPASRPASHLDHAVTLAKLRRLLAARPVQSGPPQRRGKAVPRRTVVH